MDIIGIAAISLDGCITKHQSEGVSFTSSEDKLFFRKVLRTFDCSVLGSKTFQVSKDEILKTLARERLRVVLTRQPARFLPYAQKDKLEFKNGDLEDIFAELRARNKARCAVLGGTRLYTECIQRGFMNELWVTVEPLGFGSGKRLFEGQVEFRFHLGSVERLSHDTILLKYTVP